MQQWTRQENQASVGLVGRGEPTINNKSSSSSSTPSMKKPKRILNAYNLFFKYHKEMIQEDIRCKRKVGYGNLTRIVASRWRSAAPDVKAHFTHLYMLDKKRHEREMKVWKEQTQLQAKENLPKVVPDKEYDDDEEELAWVEPIPFDDCFVEDDSNPYLVDPRNMQRLAHNLGEECTVAFLRAFMQ